METKTFTFPSYRIETDPVWTIEEEIAHAQFKDICNNHSAWNNQIVKYNDSGYVAVDIDFATDVDIVKVDNVMVSRSYTISRDERNTPIETHEVRMGTFYQLARKIDGQYWLICALDGTRSFDSPAKAKASLQRLIKDQRIQREIAEHATMIRDLAINECLHTYSDELAIGAITTVRGHGKTRLGLITGETATKWRVAFTTPSNPSALHYRMVSK